MALEDVLARCIEKWRGAGIPLSPPVEEAEIRRAWEGFGKRASEDVVRLYGTVGGFKEYEWDDDLSLWTFWPWEMVREENAERPCEGVMFCDHSLRLVNWEVRFEDDQRSSVWNIDYPSLTAPSLESFFRLYLENPDELSCL